MPFSSNRTRARSWRALLVATLLGGTALGGFAAGHGVLAAAPDAADTQVQTQGAISSVPDFANLVSRVTPAVVSVTNHLRQDAGDEQGAQPGPFGGMRPQRHAVEARGSGFIIDADGTVVTNNHVVKDAKTLTVKLSDGTELPARVVGTDPKTDLAVLKVKAGHKLPYLALGDSSKVRPGQWVVAVGNPFGLEGTVTAGIVSARGRDIGSGPYDSFLQIDAPINQGNSGGPLFTQDGSVVGVNSAIISPTGGSVGIGFAIPSDTVKTVVAQLEKDGHVTRGYLGVETQPIDAGMVAALHLKRVEPGHAGALVASVSDDSPASKAGLQPGDVIQAVNGTSVATPRELALDVANIKPGDEVKLDVVRNGDAKTMSVTVGTMPDQQVADNGASRGQDVEGQAKVGLALAPLSPDLRDQLGVPEQTKGAVVAQVESGSPADQAGIRQGDLIVGVGDKSVGSVDQALQAIKSARRDSSTLALRIVRDGHAGFVAVDLNAHKNADAETDNG